MARPLGRTWWRISKAEVKGLSAAFLLIGLAFGVAAVGAGRGWVILVFLLAFIPICFTIYAIHKRPS
jgi:hypothetical protein